MSSNHIPRCAKFKQHGLGARNEKYDAYYCPICDEWLEAQCGDENCEFCAKRPSKPSEIK